MYRIGDLEHRSRGRGFIAAHDILDDDVAGLFFCSEDGTPYYRGELVLWEVLEGLGCIVCVGEVMGVPGRHIRL